MFLTLYGVHIYTYMHTCHIYIYVYYITMYIYEKFNAPKAAAPQMLFTAIPHRPTSYASLLAMGECNAGCPLCQWTHGHTRTTQDALHRKTVFPAACEVASQAAHLEQFSDLLGSSYQQELPDNKPICSMSAQAFVRAHNSVVALCADHNPQQHY